MQERAIKAEQTCQRGAWVDPSLLRALARTYGLRYAALGILKVANDALNFAGMARQNCAVRQNKTLPVTTCCN